MKPTPQCSNNMIEPWKLFGRLGNQMFQGAYLIAEAKRDNIDDIYCQDPYYFEDYEDDIKALYRQGIPPKTDMVAIHVRRGDYVGHDFYVDLMQSDYYIKAMEMFDGADFLVFSDDIEWCKRQSIFKDCEFSHETEINDLNLMASCTGHIIANSSFSWWGAYLAPYTQKVVAPSRHYWYSDGIERTVCPSHWIRI